MDTLAQLTGLALTALPALIKKFDTKAIHVGKTVERKYADILEYPEYTDKLLDSHIKYLADRGLDAAQVQREFGAIYGTPPHAPNLPNRIVVPLYLKGNAVSWQTRSIHPACEKAYRYLTCPPDKEVVWHKSIAYGMDSVRGDSVIVVEGLFDAWKLGPGAIHVFGISWLEAQVKTLAARFKNVFIMFDAKGPDDPNGKAQASGLRLARALSGLGISASVVDPQDSKDPGDWPLAKARSIRKELLGY
jgi:hypothetical protein